MTRARGIDPGAWLSAILLLGIGWFYFWTAMPKAHPGLVGKVNNSYYNLLTRGFLKGHLSLDLVADPFLATLKDPADPKERGAHGMHDISYYHGKYYIYFGVSPVLLLFLPFRLLTGNFLDDSLAVPLFACGGLVMSVLLLRAVRLRYFAAATALGDAACVLALGLGNLVPMLLRRTAVWEVPIACGYFCCMTALLALFQAWHSPRRLGWLAVASAALGFAVGSRPTYLLGCGALLVVLISLLREAPGRAAAPDRLRLLLAALLPIAVIGSWLALYNYLRFGSPVDFGWRHMLNSITNTTVRLSSWRFLWYNLRIYALAPAGWSPYFPYVALAHLPRAPADFMLVEDSYGIVPNIPFALLGLATLGLARSRRGGPRDHLAAFCLAVGLAAAGTGLMTASFGASANRYMVDFLPAFVVLACVGFLAVVTAPWNRGRLVNLALGGLLAYSVLFNVLVSIRHNDLFRVEYPAVYRQVARVGNFPSDAVDLLLHRSYGPVEMKVIFPEDKRGTVEPLVVTGREFLADYLFVHYLGPGFVRFGLEHTSRGSLVGIPIQFKPGEVQTLRIDLGSLYPPSAHPYFDAMSPAEARLRQETVRVTCNGQVVLDRRLQLYDASSWAPAIGSSGSAPSFTRPFSGKIVAWRRMPDATLEPALGSSAGPIRLELTFPLFTGPWSDPLISSGESGHGDLVYVHYVSGNQIAFGYDHWGAGGAVGAPVTIDPQAVQTVEIDSGVLSPDGPAPDSPQEISGRHLTIRLNGRIVFDQPAPVWTCDPATIAIALNEIRASTATPVFSGEVRKVERLPVKR